jgi:hypothetical protein
MIRKGIFYGLIDRDRGVSTGMCAAAEAKRTDVNFEVMDWKSAGLFFMAHAACHIFYRICQSNPDTCLRFIWILSWKKKACM